MRGRVPVDGREPARQRPAPTRRVTAPPKPSTARARTSREVELDIRHGIASLDLCESGFPVTAEGDWCRCPRPRSCSARRPPGRPRRHGQPHRFRRRRRSPATTATWSELGSGVSPRRSTRPEPRAARSGAGELVKVDASGQCGAPLQHKKKERAPGCTDVPPRNECCCCWPRPLRPAARSDRITARRSCRCRSTSWRRRPADCRALCQRRRLSNSPPGADALNDPELDPLDPGRGVKPTRTCRSRYSGCRLCCTVAYGSFSPIVLLGGRASVGGGRGTGSDLGRGRRITAASCPRRTAARPVVRLNLLAGFDAAWQLRSVLASTCVEHRSGARGCPGLGAAARNVVLVACDRRRGARLPWTCADCRCDPRCLHSALQALQQFGGSSNEALPSAGITNELGRHAGGRASTTRSVRRSCAQSMR